MLLRTIAVPSAALLTLLVPWAASGAEYHVAAGARAASDSGPGTQSRPWRTLARAAGAARAGDTVLVHAGTYRESVVMRGAGTPGKPIVLRAFGDDVVTMDGADTFPGGRWQVSPGTAKVYAARLDRDPGQVIVDGKAIYPKIDQVGDHQWRPGTITDADVGCYQYEAGARMLRVNVGDEPARHVIRVPVRGTAITLRANCRVAGIRAEHYVDQALRIDGDDAIVEDCRAADCGGGIVVAGWDRRGAIVRRNTVIGTLGSGIFLQDRPTGCRVEDNLVVRCTLNPTRADDWLGSIKMNSAADTVFAHNVVLEAGNPATINGHDGWALWGDINIVRVVYQGNTCAHNKEAGIYVEYAMGDTRAYFNTSYRNGHGITCRQSQRGVFMRNLVLSSRGSGLAVWAGPAPYSTTDHVFAHNLVRDCSPPIWLQTEHPNFSDYNTLWPAKGAAVAWGQAPEGGKTPEYATLAAWTRATGHDAHSEVRDARPEDVGLDTVTFRVAEARDASEALMMVGNGGAELEDPSGQNVLPYFWRPGTGDGAEHTFPYAAYCGLKGDVGAMAYPRAGGTVAFPQDSADPKQAALAHGGLRYLQVSGEKPADMCREGLGFWSPCLPARAGDTCDVAFYLRGQSLRPASGSAAVAAIAEFTNATGQRRSTVDLTGGKAGAGTFGWTRIQCAVKVPAGATRMRVFVGLLPSTGDLLIDDISIKVR